MSTNIYKILRLPTLYNSFISLSPSTSNLLLFNKSSSTFDKTASAANLTFEDAATWWNGINRYRRRRRTMLRSIINENKVQRRIIDLNFHRAKRWFIDDFFFVAFSPFFVQKKKIEIHERATVKKERKKPTDVVKIKKSTEKKTFVWKKFLKVRSQSMMIVSVVIAELCERDIVKALNGSD